MKKFLVVSILCTVFATPALAENINGEDPICTSAEAVQIYTQAKMFSDFEKIKQLLSDDSCQFVEPDIKAAVMEKSLYPKVLVFVPYQAPITGWTTIENLR